MKKSAFSLSPYIQGEKLTYRVSYYNILNAGHLTLEYPETVNFNGRHAYYFLVKLKTSKLFSLFYSVNDQVKVWMDKQQHFVHAFALHIDESKQRRETRGFFDYKSRNFSFWDTKITKKGKKEEKMNWEALPLTQSVYSMVFYLRFLNFQLGQEYVVPIADKGRNLIFTAKVLRKEKLKTNIGTFPAWVLEPKIQLNGIFKPMGKILIWVSADEKKYVLKIKGKIKVGTVYINIHKREQEQKGS